jgi:starch synthase
MDTDLLGIASTGKTIQVGPENVEIMRSQCGGVEVYLLKNPTFGERPYQGEHLRALVLFSQSVFAALKELGLKPDLIHCHDWHTGLVPGYALDRQDPYFEKTAVVFTVHNLGYRGWFPHNRFVDTGLSPHILPLYDDEDDGFSLLKGGILCAGRGRVNTVSPNYAREIVETELGWGMQEVLQQVEVFGILNGIDYQVYDPARDRDILSNYGSDHFIAARRYNKRALQSVTLATLEDDERAEHLPELMPGCALEPDPDAFLIGMIARVAEQKGLGVMVEGLKLLLEGGYNVQFIFNGQPASQGDEYCREVIQLLHPLIRSYPHRILIRFSDEFDKLLGQRMYAGCDALVCTPLYEPCGLEPMKCHRYGCIPIARATGGLVDQVRDFDAERCPEGNGFLFKEFEAWAVSAAIKRAMDVFFHRKSEWYRLVERCMKIDNSWLHSARDYLSWYYHVSI